MMSITRDAASVGHALEIDQAGAGFAINVVAGAIRTPGGAEATPAIAVGDDDSGLYAPSAGVVAVSLNTATRFVFSSNAFRSDAATGGGLLNEAVSGTNPTITPNRGDTASGVGQNATNEVSLIGNSIELLRVDQSVVADDTRLLVYDVTAGALVRVSRGAVDSGGAGFRVLRIPN